MERVCGIGDVTSDFASSARRDFAAKRSGANPFLGTCAGRYWRRWGSYLLTRGLTVGVVSPASNYTVLAETASMKSAGADVNKDTG